jgi:hypothetical protein
MRQGSRRLFCGNIRPMTDHHVEVQGGLIMVTLPGSSYLVTYCKSRKGPYLFATALPTKDDRNAVLTSADFLARAWKVANHKARELKWIAQEP